MVLSVSPEEIIAGRNVSFSLSGLPLWMPVMVTFVGPQGVPVSWITPEDVYVLESDRSEATTIRMYATAGGYLDWTRYGAEDEAGAWSVDIEFAGRVYTAAYNLDSLTLRDFETVSLGTLPTKHQPPVSTSTTQTWSPRPWSSTSKST